MTSLVPALHELNGLVTPQKLAAQGFTLLPLRVTVLAATDHAGQDSYQVWVTFADDVPDEALSSDEIRRMMEWIRSTIWKAGHEDRWPYVRLKKASTLP
jgi:hypothetical protein